jgi:hypothetical protein
MKDLTTIYAALRELGSESVYFSDFELKGEILHFNYEITIEGELYSNGSAQLLFSDVATAASDTNVIYSYDGRLITERLPGYPTCTEEQWIEYMEDRDVEMQDVMMEAVCLHFEARASDCYSSLKSYERKPEEIEKSEYEVMYLASYFIEVGKIRLKRLQAA